MFLVRVTNKILDNPAKINVLHNLFKEEFIFSSLTPYHPIKNYFEKGSKGDILKITLCLK